LYLSKTGFLSKQISDDFQILIDTVLSVIDPPEDVKEPASAHPHYKYAIMGGKANESELFTAFSLYFYTNLTSPQYFTNNPGNPYREQVKIEYSLLNFTRGDLSWWNWSWNQDILPADGFGDPINGSFTSSGTEWTATIYLPLKGTNYFKDINEYDSNKFFEYNITATVITNSTYPPQGQPYNFQPNIAENQSCEDGYAIGLGGPDDPNREETLLVKLINPAEGNFSRMVNLDWQTLDGRPYAMGVFDNDSDGTSGGDEYEDQHYTIKNYYLNKTQGPHGLDDNTFQIRVVHNGSYSKIQNIVSHNNPPNGPINGSIISLIGWDPLNPIDLIEDTINTWTIEVIDNLTLNPVNITGVTYVTPLLNFSDKSPGTYTLWLRALNPYYIEAKTQINLIILEQRTELNWSDTVVSNVTGQWPIKAEIPHGNETSFQVLYSDITNLNKTTWIGDEPVSGASIICTGDNLASNEFQNNWSVSAATHTWRWIDDGNGDYSIYIDHTALDLAFNIITRKISVEIYFEITSLNFTTRAFQINLNITKRDVQINLLASSNISTFTENPNYHLFYFITFEYELLDIDDNWNTVSLSHSFVTQTYRFKVFNATTLQELVNNNGFSIVTSADPSTQYNLSMNIEGFDVSDYILQLTVDDAANSKYIYNIAKINTTFEITPAPIQVSLTPFTPMYPNNRTVISYIPNATGRDSSDKLNYQPFIKLQLIDTVYSTIDGFIHENNLIISTNYSNPNYNNFNGGASSVAEDLSVTVDDWPYTPNYLIYIDAHEMPAGGTVYFLNITFSKKNYITTDYTFSFTINNATTQFIGGTSIFSSVLFGNKQSKDTSEASLLGFPTSVYASGAHEVVVWDKMIGIKWWYKTTNGIDIKTSYPDISTINFRITNFYASSPWPENITFVNNYRELVPPPDGIYPSGTGEHYLFLIANISAEGTVNVWFNMTMWSDNFDPVSFLINFTITDRSTLAKHESSDTVADWTETIIWEYRYLDLNYSTINPISNAKHIESATFNGTTTGIIDFGNGQTANWTVTEFLTTPEKYRITIPTYRLESNIQYNITFDIVKPHYQPQTINISFILNPLEIEIEAIFKPDNAEETEEYEPDIHLRMYIEVYLTAQLKNGSVDYELNEANRLYLGIGFNVSYILWDGTTQVYAGDLVWHPTYGAYVANFSTSDSENKYLIGIFKVQITVTSNSSNFIGDTVSIKIYGIGKIEGAPPAWFWIVLTVVIGAALGMAGYGVRKALYLRIPFVLRKIDETVKKIERNRYPAVGVMKGRNEFIIDSVIDYLEMCGIEWEREDKFEIKKVGEAAKEKLPALSVKDLEQELAQISGLSKEEQALFLDELKRLDRSAQDEFLASLKGEVGQEPESLK
jgi:hypothetical protein